MVQGRLIKSFLVIVAAVVLCSSSALAQRGGAATQNTGSRGGSQQQDSTSESVRDESPNHLVAVVLGQHNLIWKGNRSALESMVKATCGVLRTDCLHSDTRACRKMQPVFDLCGGPDLFNLIGSFTEAAVEKLMNNFAYYAFEHCSLDLYQRSLSYAAVATKPLKPASEPLDIKEASLNYTAEIPGDTESAFHSVSLLPKPAEAEIELRGEPLFPFELDKEASVHYSWTWSGPDDRSDDIEYLKSDDFPRCIANAWGSAINTLAHPAIFPWQIPEFILWTALTAKFNADDMYNKVNFAQDCVISVIDGIKSGELTEEDLQNPDALPAECELPDTQRGIFGLLDWVLEKLYGNPQEDLKEQLKACLSSNVENVQNGQDVEDCHLDNPFVFGRLRINELLAILGSDVRVPLSLVFHTFLQLTLFDSLADYITDIGQALPDNLISFLARHAEESALTLQETLILLEDILKNGINRNSRGGKLYYVPGLEYNIAAKTSAGVNIFADQALTIVPPERTGLCTPANLMWDSYHFPTVTWSNPALSLENALEEDVYSQQSLPRNLDELLAKLNSQDNNLPLVELRITSHDWFEGNNGFQNPDIEDFLMRNSPLKQQNQPFVRVLPDFGFFTMTDEQWLTSSMGRFAGRNLSSGNELIDYSMHVSTKRMHVHSLKGSDVYSSEFLNDDNKNDVIVVISQAIDFKPILMLNGDDDGFVAQGLDQDSTFFADWPSIIAAQGSCEPPENILNTLQFHLR
ncbi:MAG: hypothetical protein D6719_08385 [Candidatus Dadabacteria bacterium]|nr:MAG: hypothetical protein D6719_08385 [Candidatus Dadabacteria bacterium]